MKRESLFRIGASQSSQGFCRRGVMSAHRGRLRKAGNGIFTRTVRELRCGRLSLPTLGAEGCGSAVRACVWSPRREFKVFILWGSSAVRARRKDRPAGGQTSGFPLLRSAQSGETHLAHRPSQRLIDPPASGASSGSACVSGQLTAPDGLPGVIPYPHGFRMLYRQSTVNKRYQTVRRTVWDSGIRASAASPRRADSCEATSVAARVEVATRPRAPSGRTRADQSQSRRDRRIAALSDRR